MQANNIVIAILLVVSFCNELLYAQPRLSDGLLLSEKTVYD